MKDEDKIRLYYSLFRGREDVFALRWEKSGKSGYMLAYSYDPYMYRLHKQRGGTFKDYKDKTYLGFDDFQLSRHLEGRQAVGIYPLLQDNTSWFIVADFDKKDWQEQSQKAIKICKKFNIPAYLERSRSGNGAHVWIFFDKLYPALKSRKILLSLLEEARVFSEFDKNTSFDRLFPNQDYLSGKGFGNLIALPLQGEALSQGNSCFINPETYIPFENQWAFLKSIKRVPITYLDNIYESLLDDIPKESNSFSGKLQIQLKNCIKIPRSGLSPSVIKFLKDNLNFYNSEHAIKKKIGKSTWQTERFFNLIKETDSHIEIPKGFIGNLIRFCNKNHIDYDFSDQRKLLENIDLVSTFQLLPHQDLAIKEAHKKDFGIIVAPPGSGKTIIGLKLIELKKQPALIIVHRRQLSEQWKQRIETFLGIPKREIGTIGQGKMKIGKQITVALLQTLTKKLEDSLDKIESAFGTIIIDECHHIPAKSYREVIHKLSPYYQYGLTATPFRKNNDEKLLFVYLGKVISEIQPQQIETFKKARLIVRETDLSIPFNSKTDHFETLSKVLIHDSERNKLILKDVEQELKQGRKAVILTERKEHIQTLYQYLKGKYEIIPISGDDNHINKESKWKAIQEGNYQAVITTGQYFGEGTDISEVSVLFLVYPFTFKGKLIQYIGRVQRSEITPIIYDYRDRKIPYIDRMFLKRNVYYRNLDKQATLFDDVPSRDKELTIINDIKKIIRVPIKELDFHYGMVCFTYVVPETGTALQFEIENEEIQPEFEVLKPYFSKVLKSKTVSVHIEVGIENDTIISQIAVSDDIECINKEIIDSVKFQLVEGYIVSKGNAGTQEEIQEQEKRVVKLFGSENEMLNALLKNKAYEHHRELLYLSKNHCFEILKIRFVPNPFSFVFFLEGQEKYHVILETLDTREATYIWHIPKSPVHFKNGLRQVNRELNHIRIDGRQLYLDKAPENFSKIIHDYNNEQKGFYRWKNALEERLA